MRNLSYENEFWMQFHFHANQSYFHKNGFALRLALKQRHKGTRKWPGIMCTEGIQANQLMNYMTKVESQNWDKLNNKGP